MFIDKIAACVCFGIAAVGAAVCAKCCTTIMNNDRRQREMDRDLKLIHEHYENAKTMDELMEIDSEIMTWVHEYAY